MGQSLTQTNNNLKKKKKFIFFKHVCCPDEAQAQAASLPLMESIFHSEGKGPAL